MLVEHIFLKDDEKHEKVSVRSKIKATVRQHRLTFNLGINLSTFVLFLY